MDNELWSLEDARKLYGYFNQGERENAEFARNTIRLPERPIRTNRSKVRQGLRQIGSALKAGAEKRGKQFATVVSSKGKPFLRKITKKNAAIAGAVGVVGAGGYYAGRRRDN